MVKLFAFLQSRQPIGDRSICSRSGSRRHCRGDVRIFFDALSAAQRLGLHVEGSGAIAGACAARVIASRAKLMPLPLPLLRPATARAVSARDAARCSSSVAWAMSFFARVSLAFAPVSALAFAR